MWLVCVQVLNDRSDWELRLAFFQNLVGVASFVGRDSLEHFILPCIAQVRAQAQARPLPDIPKRTEANCTTPPLPRAPGFVMPRTLFLPVDTSCVCTRVDNSMYVVPSTW